MVFVALYSVSESKTVFEGKIMTVRVDRVEIAPGVIAPREVVGHSPAVCVLPVDGDGNVYLVRQYRHPVGRELTEAPAGLMEPGETPVQAAARELKEEIGAVGELIALGDFLPTPGYCEELIHLFLAKVESFGDTAPDEDEFLQTVRMPFPEFYGQVRDGILNDGKTVAVALRAACRLGY